MNGVFALGLMIVTIVLTRKGYKNRVAIRDLQIKHSESVEEIIYLKRELMKMTKLLESYEG